MNSLPRVTVSYLGRLLAIEPAGVGALFEETCTVKLIEQTQPTYENGYKRERIEVPTREYWYAEHPQTKQLRFYTHQGFGPRIVAELARLGYPVDEYDLVPPGLEAPDFTALRQVEWRGSQSDVLSNMLACRTGVVVCPTGWGKTFVIRQCVTAFPHAHIVITVPAIDVARDIYDALADHMEVGMVGGGRVDPQRVTVAVTHSLKHCDVKKCNLLIADEVHACVTPSFRKMLVAFERAKFIGLTATPEGRSDNGDAYIEAIFGPKIAEVPYQEAVDSGNVVPLSVWVFDVPTGPNVQSIKQKHLKDRHGIWANPVRNELIATTVAYAEQRLHRTDLQILIMVDKAEHAYRLQQLLPDFTVVTGAIDDERVGVLEKRGALLPTQQLCTPKDRQRYKEQFAAGTLKRVICTFVWSKGVNFLDLDVLIRADGLASPIQSGQVPGRLSRLGSDGNKEGGILIDFRDSFSPDLKSRSLARFKAYKSNGWQVEAVA